MSRPHFPHRNANDPSKLSEYSLSVGDLVLYESVKESTGGVIYQIFEDQEPVEGNWVSKTIKVKRYNSASCKYELVDSTSETLVGPDDKKILVAATNGFVRIKPIFDFFATWKGKKPRGKDDTIIIEYYRIATELTKVDIVLLGTKYLELGLLLKDIARRGGSDVV